MYFGDSVPAQLNDWYVEFCTSVPKVSYWPNKRLMPMATADPFRTFAKTQSGRSISWTRHMARRLDTTVMG